jgi:hypothetical protein
MAGAFLPWEKWIAQLLHPFVVAARRWLWKRHRERLLAGSTGWPEAEGTVISIKWDTSFPREEILFNYRTELGYYAGSYWHWFEKSEAREIRAGDRLLLRYSREDPEKSVFLRFSESPADARK